MKGVSSVNEFLNRAHEWINLEEAEASAAGTSQVPKQTAGVGTKVVTATQNVTQNNQFGGGKIKGNGEGNQHGPKKNKSVEKFKPVYATYTELTHSRENIFLAKSTRLPWKRPEPLKHQKGKRDTSKFCRFHNDVGHNTDDCRHLKDEIETLIRVGPLAQYARNRVPTSRPAPEAPIRQPGSRIDQDIPPPVIGGEISTISGGPHVAGMSRGAQKRYVNELKVHNGVEFAPEQRLPKQQRLEKQPIIFT